MRHVGKFIVVGMLALGLDGCEDAIDLDPLDDTPPVEARVRPKPIAGGTLTIVGESVAVASDPDRDVVHVVDLDSRALRHTIALDAGDEPGRVVDGDGGVAHVVLRGFGGIATIDVDAGTVLARHRLCADPRGVAMDPGDGTLHVACAEGTLLQVDLDGTVLTRTELEPDLRDVVVLDGEVYASVFRAAALVRADGERAQLPGVGSRIARVAWKTWAEPRTGAIFMLHQAADTVTVPIEVDPDEVGAGGSPYGGGGDAFCEPGLTGPVLAMVEPEGGVTTYSLNNARLTVAAAVSPDGEWFALAMPGVEDGQASVHPVPAGGQFCFDEDDQAELRGLGQVTAVAFAPSGTLVMQSREPARLIFQDDFPGGEVEAIDLAGESRLDTGHEIFHRATESTLSCASCHPEGTDDGHTWRFDGLGLRRTQPLDIGLADSEPFHWDGDMDDLDMIMGEVLAHRMGGMRQSKARRESFARWMFEQDRPPARADMDDPGVVADGEALFTTHACDKCHTGPKLGGANTETIDGARLQVPTLRRVSLRAPFMHDGRAATLHDAVRDMIERTVEGEVPAADVDALVAYMRTL